jgi:hypothetical protein
MILATLLLATFAATSLMTAFSYLVSESFRKLYKEPLLLQFMLDKTGASLSGTVKAIAAWIIHYLIGLLFVTGYYLLYTFGMYGFTWVSGLIFGVIIGVIGILGWQLMFSLANYTPKIDFKGYYIQLYIAHLIFGLATAAVCYTMFR